MRVQDFAYQVALRTMELLEQQQHYKIPENTRKEVLQRILTELNDILRKAG